MKVYNIIIVAALLLFSIDIVQAQTDREIIIVEKTIDADGNEVSKKIIRRSGEGLSDDEVEDILDEQRPFGQFDIEALGFGPDIFETWGDWLQPKVRSERPSIGVSLSFEHDRVLVVTVVQGSGAADSDIRPDDEIVSIEGVPVRSYQEIQDIIGDMSTGDEIRIVIYRDGQEIEKVVALKGSADDSTFRSFGFDLGDMMRGAESMDMDSIFDQLRIRGMDAQMRRGESDYQIDQHREQRASLGAYIDDSHGQIEISDLVDDGAADRAGLRVGDRIISLDDQQLSSFSELRMLMSRHRSGDEVGIGISRNGKKHQVDVILD